LEPARRDLLVGHQKRLSAIVGEALRQETPDALSDPVRLHAVTMTVFGMLNWYYMWSRPGKGLGREEYGDLLTDMVLGGIRGLGVTTPG
jgi:hypothetical protein